MNIRRLRGEQGTSLLLALAFIALLGIFTVAILGVSFSDFKTTTVVRTRTDMLYGADGAADYALAQMQDTAGCLSSGSVTPPTLNGSTSTVTYACTGGTQTVDSTNPFMGSYSVIANGASTGYGIYLTGAYVPTPSPALNINIYGDAYSKGRNDLDAGGASDANKLVINGDLAVGGSPCSWNTTTDPMVTGSCSASQSAPSVSAPTVFVTTTNAPTVSTSGSCTMLYPGEYGPNGRALPTFDPTKGYYLASGTYYFNGTGDVNLTGWIQGGAPGSTTTTALTTGFTSRCPASFASDANARTLKGTSSTGYPYTGSGVTIVLGGNAVLRYTDNANTRAEWFPRVASSGPDSAATDGVSVWGRMNSTSGATGAAYTTMSQYEAYYTNGAGATGADVVHHGFVYMPDSKIWPAFLRNTDAGVVAGSVPAQFRGGVYIEKIALKGDNNTGEVPLAGIPSSTIAAPRSVTFTVTTRQAGQSSCSSTYPCTTLTIVAVYPTDGTTPDIQSWRKTSAT